MDYIERDADLFQAGEYPDRGLTVTEDHIRSLARTDSPIPIFVNHNNSQFQLGHVNGLQAAGKWLKGKLNLIPSANALLEQLGMRKLSVAVTRAMDKVTEVSIVDAPRVAGAQMFSGETVMFSLGESPIPPKQEEKTMAEGTPGVTMEQFSQLQANFARLNETLEAQKATIDTLNSAKAAAEQMANAARADVAAFQAAMRIKEANSLVEQFSRERRLPPSCHAEALALLTNDGVMRFADGDKPTSEIAAALFAKLPPILGDRLTGAGAAGPAASMSQEAKEYFAAKFPGLDLKDIQANMGGSNV